MATLYQPTNTVIDPVEPRDPARGFTLQELQSWVKSERDRDGKPLDHPRTRAVTVQVIQLSDGRLMAMDEDGKGKRLSINDPATDLARDVLGPYDVIVGPALVCNSWEIK